MSRDSGWDEGKQAGRRRRSRYCGSRSCCSINPSLLLLLLNYEEKLPAIIPTGSTGTQHSSFPGVCLSPAPISQDLAVIDKVVRILIPVAITPKVPLSRHPEPINADA